MEEDIYIQVLRICKIPSAVQTDIAALIFASFL